MTRALGRRGSRDRTAGAAGRDRGDRGAVSVEFALVLPILIMLVFGIIDFGFMVNRNTMINNVSRDAVRVGSLNGRYADVSSTVTSALTAYGIPAAAAAVTICAKPDDGTACSVAQTPAAYDAAVAVTGGAKVVTVKIDYTHRWITPTMSTLLGSTIALSKQTTMRVE
ncbi:MAG: TadE/TadG family type IV pilus assembly protein [Nocardioidaceae bacterium]